MAQVFSALGLAAQQQIVFFEPILPFFVSVYLACSFLGMSISGYIYAWKLYKKTGFRKLRPNYALGGATLAAAVFIVYWLGFELGVAPQKTALVGLLLAPAVFLVIFKKDVSEKVALRWVSRKDFEDEDIISTEMLPEKIVQKYKIERVLTTEQRKVLEKVEHEEGIHKFPVQKDLPRFGPYILAGLVVCLLVPDLLLLLF
jgi:hypothetical protein